MKKRPKFYVCICVKENEMGIGAVVGIDDKGSPGLSPGVVLKSSNDIYNIIINPKVKK